MARPCMRLPSACAAAPFRPRWRTRSRSSNVRLCSSSADAHTRRAAVLQHRLMHACRRAATCAGAPGPEALRARPAAAGRYATRAGCGGTPLARPGRHACVPRSTSSLAAAPCSLPGRRGELPCGGGHPHHAGAQRDNVMITSGAAAKQCAEAHPSAASVSLLWRRRATWASPGRRLARCCPRGTAPPSASATSTCCGSRCCRITLDT